MLGLDLGKGAEPIDHLAQRDDRRTRRHRRERGNRHAIALDGEALAPVTDTIEHIAEILDQISGSDTAIHGVLPHRYVRLVLMICRFPRGDHPGTPLTAPRLAIRLM